MMAREEQTQRYSNSSTGGCGGGSGGGTGCGSRSSKKLKQKKVPQRGLGVAQLEKIRLEEQQKKDVAIFSPSSIISPSNSSCLAVQCINFRPTLSPSLPLGSPADVPLPNSILRPSPFTPSIEAMRSNSVPISISNNVSGCKMGWQISSSAPGNWPKFGEYHLEGDHKLDHQGSTFRSNVNLPSDSNTRIWPLPGIMQRSEQFQQTCPSSMVNVPSGTSSSSIMNFQIEPPSNQSYCNNNYTPLWPEEERMGGIKRSYPFSIDDAPGPSFNSNFPPAYASPIPRTDETASCSNDGTFNIKPAANPVLREGPSSSSRMSEPKMRKVIEENGFFDGDFLTLAPPKPKHPSSSLIPHRRGLLDFDALPYQGTTNGIVKWPGPGRSIQQPFFSFLPSANTQNDQSAATISNSNGIVESIDLNLKL